MATLIASNVVARALRLLRITGEGETADARDMQAGWEAMTTMLDAWNGDPGMVPDLCDDFVMPGFTSLADAVEMPQGSAGLPAMLVYNLAVEMAPEFGATVDPMVMARAQSTMRNWRTRVAALHIGRLEHPELSRGGHYDIRAG